MVEDRRNGMKNGRRAEDIYARWNVKVRDSIIFLVGVTGVINELFIVPDPRPSILIFLGSLIGVPFVLSADEKRTVTDNEEKRDKEEGSS